MKINTAIIPITEYTRLVLAEERLSTELEAERTSVQNLINRLDYIENHLIAYVKERTSNGKYQFYVHEGELRTLVEALGLENYNWAEDACIEEEEEEDGGAV